ncbi:hypothetical protein Tco_1053573 [Tanacetum coccineum]|uniref:Uncharacterized protein n=1 Tax=Tanacetum coccineum TaxID=301880 RepID=A0ABQ5GUA0_9ASTR
MWCSYDRTYQRTQLWSTTLRMLPNSIGTTDERMCYFMWWMLTPGPSTPQVILRVLLSRPSHYSGGKLLHDQRHSPRLHTNLRNVRVAQFVKFLAEKDKDIEQWICVLEGNKIEMECIPRTNTSSQWMEYFNENLPKAAENLIL